MANDSASAVTVEAEIITNKKKEKTQFARLKPYEIKVIETENSITEENERVFCLIIKHPHFVYIEKK